MTMVPRWSLPLRWARWGWMVWLVHVPGVKHRGLNTPGYCLSPRWGWMVWVVHVPGVKHPWLLSVAPLGLVNTVVATNKTGSVSSAPLWFVFLFTFANYSQPSVQIA